jgi:hypothetical protein
MQQYAFIARSDSNATHGPGYGGARGCDGPQGKGYNTREGGIGQPVARGIDRLKSSEIRARKEAIA